MVGMYGATVFDEQHVRAIANCSILLVGVGGVGCEVLKSLVLSGFPKIEIIDLDTIEVSNLNRQFLFHKEDVGKSKVQVAKRSALRINPHVKISTHNDNVNNYYGVGYYKRFNIVISALDNTVARKHLNRMCLAGNVPLIETGTAGYTGQVEVFKTDMTQCYECQSNIVQKSFSSRTIRNTPSKLIHCIIWAKHLFNQLFGKEEPDEEVSPDLTDPEAAGGLPVFVPNIKMRALAVDCSYDASLMFVQLFLGDVRTLLLMENLWRTRRPPSPLRWYNLPHRDEPPAEHSGLPDQRVWSIYECAQMFALSVKALREQMLARPAGNYLVWDKDEKHAMDFVTATANVRAHVFGIPTTSRFEIKALAADIRPASASSIAIVAGLAVMRVHAILKGDIVNFTSVYLRSKVNHRGQLIVPEKTLTLPNPKCYFCGPVPEVDLACDLKKFKLKDLTAALKGGLSMQSPDAIVEWMNVVILSSEEGETDHNNEKTLYELGLFNGCTLIVDDFIQHYEIRVRLQNDENEISWRFLTDEPMLELAEPQPDPFRMDTDSDVEIVEIDHD